MEESGSISQQGSQLQLFSFSSLISVSVSEPLRPYHNNIIYIFFKKMISLNYLEVCEEARGRATVGGAEDGAVGRPV